MAPQKMRRWAKDALGTVLLFVAYFVTARLGLLMDAVAGFATLVWPPTGIALAALVLFGARLWPGVLAGEVSRIVWGRFQPELEDVDLATLVRKSLARQGAQLQQA